MARVRPQLAGIGMIMAAMTLIPIGDSAAKMLMIDGASGLFVAWSRLVLAMLLLVPFLNGVGRSLKVLIEWRVMLRASLSVFSIICMFVAMETEALATVFGVFFIGPILSYFLSVALLGERIGILQTVLLLVGFCGVLLVIQPEFLSRCLVETGAESGLTRGTLLALIAGISFSGFLISGRWLKALARPLDIILAQLVLGAVVLTPFGLAQMPPVTLGLSGLTLVSATMSLSGNLLMLLAYRRTEASRLAPFVYLQLIMVTLFGYLFFGELPDRITFTGLGLLVFSGLASTFLLTRRG